MCTQGDIHVVVHIEPFWVVVHFVCLKSNASHEAKRLIEVLELELLLNGITPFHHLPACTEQWLQLLRPFTVIELDALCLWGSCLVKTMMEGKREEERGKNGEKKLVEVVSIAKGTLN